MNKKLFITTCILAAIAVILGAFGAHFLKENLEASRLASYETGIRYQFYHVFAMLFACLFAERFNSKKFVIAGWLFFIGILLFSGSIYLLSTRELTGLASYKWLGPITPIGGLCLISGWLTMMWAGMKSENTTV